MKQREIQRLAAADLNPDLFRELADHGEDLLVERKSQLPEPERLGAEVASMANMLGGWLLLGVDDKTRKLGSLDLKPGLDPQSHVGHLLRQAVDPVPPFLAGLLDVDGVRVGFVRVFQASVPVIVSGSGAVYSRDAGGKVPISSHRELLELARRGREAEEEARTRSDRNRLSLAALGLPPEQYSVPEFQMKTIVRAAPLSVTPQLSEWPISAGPNACFEAASWLAGRVREDATGFAMTTRPLGRGVAVFADPISPRPLLIHRVSVVADCAGVLGASAWKDIPNVLPTHELRRSYIRPVIEVVAALLEKAEAYGDAVLELNLIHRRDEVLLQDELGRSAGHKVDPQIHCGSAILGVPADDEDRAELAKRWEREVARNAGIGMWETPAGSP